MTRARRFTIAAIALVWGAAAAKSRPVTFVSPRFCRDAHGKDRLSAKTDPSLPPTDENAIQSVTPSDIFSWPGPAVHLTRRSKRIAAENKWCALRGRVVDLKVEADGDIHLALADATGNKPGLLLLKSRQKRMVRYSEGRFQLDANEIPFSRSIWQKAENH